MLRPISRPITCDRRVLTLAPLLLTVVFFVASFPKFHQSYLAWIALVPLLEALEASSSGARAFGTGWFTGLLVYSGLLYWIIVTFQAAHLSMGLALLSLVALSAYLALFWGAWALIVYRLRDRGALLYVLGSAAAWAALEWARTYLFTGFPWTLLADSQYRHPLVLQIVSVTGTYGLSFLIVAVNAALAALLLRKRRALQTAAWCSLLIATVLAGSFGRLRGAAPAWSGPTLKVALLQGSIDQYKKWDRAYVEDIEATYGRLAAEAARRNPDLILWPETSVPGYLLQDPPLRDWLVKTVQATRAFNIAGAPVLHERLAYNSAFVLDPNGQILGEYTKQHLVPFGETVPFGKFLGRFIHVLNALGGFASKEGKALLWVNGHPIGVNICYEAIFPAIVRRSVADGAQLIANLTNDGWYMNTAAPYQHFAPNVLRAVENGRWLIRADNTGISARVDPFGRIQDASPIFEPVFLMGDVQLISRRTIYSRLGDTFAALCTLLTVWLLTRRRLAPDRTA